jgi:hypothetical protein
MMSQVIAGMLIGAVVGSLVTAAYIGICLKEEEEGSRSWIDEAIVRAFSAVEISTRRERYPGN